MNFSPSFKHEDRVFSYRFFGLKSKTTNRFSIEGLYIYAFTPIPVKIFSKKLGGSQKRSDNLPGRTNDASFETRFGIECQDPLLHRAFSESGPFQNLVGQIFAHNVVSLEIREEVMTLTFQNPVRGRVKGKTNRICTENPVDAEWVKGLRISLIKMANVINETSLMSKNFKERDLEPKRGLIFGLFFGFASAFILTAFFVTKYWFQ